MKKALFRILAATALVALLAPVVRSFAQSPGDYEAQWITDFELATATAKQENRYVLLDFTGSDWCPPCKAVRAEVLTQKEFVDYANKHLVPVMVDFPRYKEQSEAQQDQNSKLAERFGIRAFPTFILLDPQGKEVARHMGYFAGGPERFVQFLDAEVKSGK